MTGLEARGPTRHAVAFKIDAGLAHLGRLRFLLPSRSMRRWLLDHGDVEAGLPARSPTSNAVVEGKAAEISRVKPRPSGPSSGGVMRRFGTPSRNRSGREALAHDHLHLRRGRSGWNSAPGGPSPHGPATGSVARRATAGGEGSASRQAMANGQAGGCQSCVSTIWRGGRSGGDQRLIARATGTARRRPAEVVLQCPTTTATRRHTHAP